MNEPTIDFVLGEERAREFFEWIKDDSKIRQFIGQVDDIVKNPMLMVGHHPSALSTYRWRGMPYGRLLVELWLRQMIDADFYNLLNYITHLAFHRGRITFPSGDSTLKITLVNPNGPCSIHPWWRRKETPTNEQAGPGPPTRNGGEHEDRSHEAGHKTDGENHGTQSNA